MHNLTMQLISRAPILLVGTAVVLLFSGILNALSSFQSMQEQGSFPVTYLFSFLFTALYQPVMLIAWASAIHYLSILATRMR